MTPATHQVSVRTDPRRPFVLDTRPLGRRPGSIWEGEITVPATDDLGLDLIRVTPGTALELQLRLESVLDGVLVTATVTAPVVGECARCLEEVRDTVRADFLELWSYPEQVDRYLRTAGPGQGQDEEVARLDGDLLNLEQVVRDAVALALPASPLCREDCAGLCSECGMRLDDVGPDHGHGKSDPRWVGLEALRDSSDSDV
jgi:uncharacterized protein